MMRKSRGLKLHRGKGHAVTLFWTMKMAFLSQRECEGGAWPEALSLGDVSFAGAALPFVDLDVSVGGVPFVMTR